MNAILTEDTYTEKNQHVPSGTKVKVYADSCIFTLDGERLKYEPRYIAVDGYCKVSIGGMQSILTQGIYPNVPGNGNQITASVSVAL